jgi:hypothetical protein
MRVFSAIGLAALVLISQIAADEKGSRLRRRSGLAGAPPLDREGSEPVMPWCMGRFCY